MRCALGEMIIASVEATGLIVPWIIGANYQHLFHAHRPLVQGQKNQDAEFLANLRALSDATNTRQLRRKMAIRMCTPMRANYHFVRAQIQTTLPINKMGERQQGSQ
jgi:hypothetical protein